MGVTLDRSGSGLPDVTIHLVNQDIMQDESTTSDEQGRFGFQFLSPGRCELRAGKASFEPLRPMVINITVTETLRIELYLRLSEMSQSIHVSSDVLMVQTDNSSLGRVVGGQTLSSLPLVTRNFAQIAVLSPGVTPGVFNGHAAN